MNTRTAWVNRQEDGARHLEAEYDDGHYPDPIDPRDVARFNLANRIGERIEVFFEHEDDQFCRVQRVDGPCSPDAPCHLCTKRAAGRCDCGGCEQCEERAAS